MHAKQELSWFAYSVELHTSAFTVIMFIRLNAAALVPKIDAPLVPKIDTPTIKLYYYYSMLENDAKR